MTKKNVTYFGILNYSSKFRKRQMRSQQASNHQKTKKITDLVVEPFQIGRCLCKKAWCQKHIVFFIFVCFLCMESSDHWIIGFMHIEVCLHVITYTGQVFNYHRRSPLHRLHLHLFHLYLHPRFPTEILCRAFLGWNTSHLDFFLAV